MIQLCQNPKFSSEDDYNQDYSKNCQSCVIAAELNCRGYDVEAIPWNNDKLREVASIDKSAYIDPNTGEMCIPQRIYVNPENTYDYLKKNMIPNARYEFGYYLTPDAPDVMYEDTEGHVVIMTKDTNNNILIYDPQNGNPYEHAQLYFNSVVNKFNTKYEPGILRIDDKAVNPKYIHDIVRKMN